jgi:uncharacterized membrane protein
MMSTRNLVRIAAIAAIYAVLTLALAPISYGQIQVRVSEALTVLPFVTPLAIPGVAIGCLIANFLGPGLGLLDVIFGTAATLLAAVVTWRMPKAWLAPLPPVIANGLIIGALLHYTLALPLVPSVLWVGLGELIACYAVGYPLLLFIQRNPRLKQLLED